jgi:HPt (histidine-containing phosphotransfer) domain-containing protein
MAMPGVNVVAGPVPASLVTFFQQEALEYLDRLDQVVNSTGDAPPDLGAFLAHARALRGSASMARLEGLAELAATVERVGSAVRDDVIRWDQRLQFAVRGALVEIRALVDRAGDWGEPEIRRARQQGVALGAVAAGYLRTPAAANTAAARTPVAPAVTDHVVPIATLFIDDREPGLVHRGPMPPMTAGQRFRAELAELSRPLGEAAHALRAASPALRATAHVAVLSTVRAIGTVAESFGAASIVTLAQRIAAAPLESDAEYAALDALVRLLGDRTLDDGELAARIRMQRSVWGTPSTSATPVVPSLAIPAAPTPTPVEAARTTTPPTPPTLADEREPAADAAVMSIDALVLDAPTALVRALEVRTVLRARLARSPSLADPVVRALLDELFDLVALANGRNPTD